MKNTPTPPPHPNLRAWHSPLPRPAAHSQPLADCFSRFRWVPYSILFVFFITVITLMNYLHLPTTNMEKDFVCLVQCISLVPRAASGMWKVLRNCMWSEMNEWFVCKNDSNDTITKWYSWSWPSAWGDGWGWSIALSLLRGLCLPEAGPGLGVQEERMGQKNKSQLTEIKHKAIPSDLRMGHKEEIGNLVFNTVVSLNSVLPMKAKWPLVNFLQVETK